MVDVRPKQPAPPPGTVEPTSAEGRLSAALLGGRRWREVVVPRTDPPVRGRMRRLTRAEEEQVSLELGRWRKTTAEAGLPPEARLELSTQEVVRVLAIAIRRDEAGDDPPALATLAEWSRADEGQLGALHRAYVDLVDETDLGLPTLDAGQLAELRDAVKKKDATRLLSFGAAALTAWLISTGDPPAS